MMHDSIEKRVDKGVSVLDFYIPNWRDLIDVDRLKMSDCDDCIMGQLDAWFLVPSSPEATECGFLHSDGPFLEFKDSREEYSLLQNEWLSRINHVAA